METQTIVINVAPETAQAVQKELELIGCDCELTPRRNLDGEVATWIVVANLAVTVFPHVLSFIKDLLARGTVTKISYDGLEITNPTSADVERFRALLDEKVKSARPT